MIGSGSDVGGSGSGEPCTTGAIAIDRSGNDRHFESIDFGRHPIAIHVSLS